MEESNMERLPLDTITVREVKIRYRGRALAAREPITQPRNLVHLAQRIVTDDAREHFLAVYLDGRNRPLAHSVVSVGTATASLVHPREVFSAAVRESAEACGHEPVDITSGAGHDACYVSKVAPTGMLFIPCEDGLSHNEAENITADHAIAGAEVTLRAVLRLGQ